MKKFFYDDCHLREFTATVTGCSQTDRGWQITLDATAFYPEGGGQACDIGTLGGVSVLDVREQGEEILHLCDGPLVPGKEVTGRIDWPRRFDLMQQHTGEHILSGLIHRHFGGHNVGFHVGRDVMEVDFDIPLSARQLEFLENAANEAVWADLPVECFVPDADALAQLSYRSKRRLPWPVRIVQIPGIDSCACCGVHTARTGEVGLIKILSCAKFHGGSRLELVCGNRALNYVCAIFEQNRQISQLLSAKMPETADAVRHLSDALAAEKQRSADMQKQLFADIAKNYVNQGDVLHFADGLSAGELRLLAEQIADSCRGRAAVFSGEDAAYLYCLAQPGGDLRPLGKTMTEALNGRGGGKPEFQQGSLRATRQQIAAFFADPAR